ncbi:TauD/TfdA family dioxygenase [Variovorax paradoxus]|nr:TauD/TfdA family dioxygenase [Variovorax paradoxus]
MIRHEVLPVDGMSVVAWQPRQGAQDDLSSVCAWLIEYREALDADVAAHGGVLVRGFDALGDAEAFAQALHATGSQLMDYVGGTSPRKKVTGRILTATEVPGSYSIPLHQEMSYTDGAPCRIAFFCETPASSDGCTTVGDMRAITRAIDPSVVDRFLSHGGLQLRRNLPLPQHVDKRPGVPKSWPEVFNTQDPVEAQSQARARGWRFEWQSDGSMTLWQEIRPALKRHPGTGDEVWFNQVHIFAPAAAMAWAKHDGRLDMADRLERAMRDTPHQLDCFVFADGSDIPDEDALHVYEVLDRLAEPLHWQRGDLLILDNVLTGHGRKSFVGERRVLTALIAGVGNA